MTALSAEDSPNVLGPDLAPTPFTADEIRTACPEGREMTVRTEMAGEQATYRRIRFISVDSIGATQAVSRLTVNKEQVGDTNTTYATWGDLQAHASFPRRDTTIDRETIDTPMGRLECIRYRVRDGSRVDTFWFAVELPGMPVRFTTSENGTVTSTTEMISNVTP